jgi:NAD(P)-dependent dehydrogenase (short-subunit alcohol dehydrogenase family)
LALEVDKIKILRSGKNNMSGLFDLSRKTAVVVGGASGIGLGIAKGLADHGAKVVLADLQKEKAMEAAAELCQSGLSAQGYYLDVVEQPLVEKVFTELWYENDGIDILVNSAGYVVRKPALELTAAEWQKIQDVNLRGTFFTCRAAGSHMIKRSRGKIINVASVSASLGHPDRAAYAASKGGVAQLTKVLANEWARYQVMVNAICPTVIQTPFNEALWQDSKLRQKIIDKIPLGRLGQTEDLVGPAVFLASSASDFVTGHLLYVDGGRTID